MRGRPDRACQCGCGSGGVRLAADVLMSRCFNLPNTCCIMACLHHITLLTSACLPPVIARRSCPICFDSLTTRTITACGHHFCGSCIREVLAHGTRICPICRTRE